MINADAQIASVLNMAEKTTSKRPVSRRVWRFVWKFTMWFFIITISWVILYKWLNPPTTFLQLRERINCPDGVEFHKSWVDSEDISVYMKLAVVASEDNNFMKHNGLDWGAIEKAKKYNASHKKTRGASTITQQVAKNVFLWPSRSWIRKGFEVYFTYLIEFFWSKDRIMEVYLNVIEMGPCKFGIGAAAQDYFHKPASDLTREQAALIAACLPNPRKMSPSKPGPYLLKRQGQIARLTRLIGDNYFERYSGKMEKQQRIKEEEEVQQKIERLPSSELPELPDEDNGDIDTTTEEKEEIPTEEPAKEVSDSSAINI